MPQTNQLNKPVEAVVIPEQVVEEVEFLQSSIQAGTIAQIVIAAIAVIGLIYLLKLVLVTALVSVLLAYVLEPPVEVAGARRIPRWLGALLVVSAVRLLRC